MQVKQGNMMYNTMYGGNGAQSSQGVPAGSQSAMQKHGPIHIKIEDQTGVNAMGKVQNSQTKKQFQ